MPTMRVLKAVYYLAAIGFHWFLFFTNIGNYFHGGTPLEWIVLEAVAVLIVAMAIKLVPKVRTTEKILMTLCALAPAISVVWSLVEAIRR